MLIIKDQIYAGENKRHNPNYTRGGAFFEDIAIQNWINTGMRWFNLMGYEELIEFVKEMCMTIIKPNNYLCGFADTKGTMRFPYIDRSVPYNPIVFNPPMNDNTRNFIKEWVANVENHPNQSF